MRAFNFRVINDIKMFCPRENKDIEYSNKRKHGILIHPFVLGD